MIASSNYGTNQKNKDDTVGKLALEGEIKKTKLDLVIPNYIITFWIFYTTYFVTTIY